MEFFAPLFNHLAFSYEWMERPGFNWEAGLGFIGVGVGENSQYSIYNLTGKPTGFYLRGGPKFLLGSSSDVEVEGARIAHPLKGRYFKIEAILQTMTAHFSADTGSSYNPPYGYGINKLIWEKSYQSFALNLVYGKQFIFGNSITVGYYLGVGYCVENINTSGNTPPPNQYGYSYVDDFFPRRYSFVYFGKSFPMTFTWGFTIGYILERKQPTGKKSYRNNPHA